MNGSDCTPAPRACRRRLIRLRMFQRVGWLLIGFLAGVFAVPAPSLSGAGLVPDSHFQAAMQELVRGLQDLRRREWLRAWSTPGLAARQAAWNVAKADYVLYTTHALDAGALPTAQRIQTLQTAYDRLLRAEAASRMGARHMPEESGAVLRAYISKIDDSLQTYSLSIPAAYDPNIAWPLIISLHGHGWYRPFQGHPAPRFSGAFCLSPQGRGATDYKALGEMDVLRALAEVEHDYNIDRDRVYLTGMSMGGTGSWEIGVHHADLFAGIMPISGNADYRAWTARWGWNRPFPGRFDTLRFWLQESRTPRAFAENLEHLPVWCIHGAGDAIVPPEHARNMVAALRAAGCRVEYREFPGKGHGGFPGSSLSEGRAWICGQVRVRWPRRLRWRAASLRHGKAWWLRMLQMERPCRFMEIQARVAAGNHLRIATRNLQRFAFIQAPELFDPSRPVFLDCDGSRVIFPPARAGRPERRLVRIPGKGWFDAAETPEIPAVRHRKRPGLEGPIDAVLLHPFVLVLGTASRDAGRRALWRGEVQRFIQEWRRRNNAPCPAVLDTEMTPEWMRNRDLILFGGPADNRVSAQLAPQLPIAAVTALLPEAPLDLADSAAAERLLHARADRGLFLLYPNPLVPNRLVVLIDAAGPAAIYQAWQRFGNWFDWGVYDSDKYFDFAVYDALSASPESMELVGWFGRNWTLEGAVWRLGVPAVRAAMAPQAFPPAAGADQAPAGPLLLDALRPARIDQMRGAVGIDRSFYGHSLPRPGLGVRAPSAIEYDIAGKYREFTAEGVLLNDPESAQCRQRFQAEVIGFTVKGDGRILAQAPQVDWNHPSARLRADVRGVHTLRLEVRVRNGPAWLHGSAAWLEPKLAP